MWILQLILSKKDEQDFSVNGVLFPVFHQQIEEFQKNLSERYSVSRAKLEDALESLDAEIEP